MSKKLSSKEVKDCNLVVVLYYLTKAVYGPASDLVKAVPGSWAPAWLGLSGNVLRKTLTITSRLG